MGIKKFFQELKIKVPPPRLFKALTIESQDVLPKLTNFIKSVEVVEGHGLAAGSVVKTLFPDGKYMTHKIDTIDEASYVCIYVLIDSEFLGDKLEKVCYELKIEASEGGGSVIKLDMEYHTKGAVEITEGEIKAGAEHAVGLYKACEEYLVANPNVCA